MKLTRININFGYNKRLNQKLNEKLDKSEQTASIKLIRTLNSSCNETESSINQLENPSQGGIDRNQEQINILLNYFIPAKATLCSLVDRFFPELSFGIRTIDELDREDTERGALYQSIPKQEADKLCYRWRESLFNILEKNIATKEALSTPNRLCVAGVEYDEEDGENQEVLTKFEPSSSSPKSLDDVVGLEKTIKKIKNYLIFPLENPQEAQKREEDYGIKVPNFSVFFGPPGCGKTMLAQAISAQTGCDMYMLDLSQVGSSYVNGTVINIRKAFDEVEKIAKHSDKPVILFMDEMDSLLSKREGSLSQCKEDDKVVNAILPLLSDTFDKNILVIGATNMYNSLDSALIRRIKFGAYIGLPSEEEIKKLLIKRLTSFKMGVTLAQNEKEIQQIAKSLTGYSPSNIVDMVSQTSEIACENQRELKKEDFDVVLKEGNWQKIDESEYLPENKAQKKVVKGFLENK